MEKVLHDIDLKLLKIFAQVAKAKSFSVAAEKLNTSPPNISMNMAKLESRLEMRLCERGVSGFKLTPQGEEVLAASEKLNEAIGVFQRQMRILSQTEQKVIHIGVLGETSFDENMRVSDILVKLEEALPGALFHLEFTSAERIRELVAEDELHCAIGYFSDVDWKMNTRYLYSEQHFCYCGKSHELFEVPDDEITSDMLAAQKIAGYDDMTEDERLVVPLFGKFDSCARTNEGFLALLRTGSYIGLLPESYAKYWHQEGVIRPIDIEDLSLNVDIDLIYKASRASEPELQALLSSIDECYPESADAE